MATADVLQGRDCFEKGAWGEAYAQLSAAEREMALEPDDLERLGTAAYLTGRDVESVDAWTRAHHGLLDRNEAARAARCAFWLGASLMMRGEMAPASGWLGRAHTVLEERELDCVEQGYLLIPSALHALAGDPTAALATFEQVVAIGDRFQNAELVALGRLGRGQALIRLQETNEAVAMLDQAMVSVMAGEVSPIPAGIIYCAVILACQEAFDLRRAQEWTEALGRWCESQPDLVLYRGQCLVHRSEILQMRGAWSEAMEEVLRARARLSEPPWQPAVGMACYQLGELHRLRGEFAQADKAYSQAHQRGRDPQPGLALLRQAQGRLDAAEAAIRRAIDELQDPVSRPNLLGAYVEIMLAVGDVDAARSAADELAGIATGIDAPLLHAICAHSQGAVLLAEGEERAAGDQLRRAWAAWQGLEAPYEAARARVLIGLSCRKLGDTDTAAMELDAARWTFHQLGAAPDLARVEQLVPRARPKAAGGLTSREVEVLGLVASGKTNREIATELVISEKTVARHLSNIFTKLGVSTRSAATAYAYEHDLVGGPKA